MTAPGCFLKCAGFLGEMGEELFFPMLNCGKSPAQQADFDLILGLSRSTRITGCPCKGRVSMHVAQNACAPDHLLIMMRERNNGKGNPKY